MVVCARKKLGETYPTTGFLRNLSLVWCYPWLLSVSTGSMLNQPTSKRLIIIVLYHLGRWASPFFRCWSYCLWLNATKCLEFRCFDKPHFSAGDFKAIKLDGWIFFFCYLLFLLLFRNIFEHFMFISRRSYAHFYKYSKQY